MSFIALLVFALKKEVIIMKTTVKTIPGDRGSIILETPLKEYPNEKIAAMLSEVKKHIGDKEVINWSMNLENYNGSISITLRTGTKEESSNLEVVAKILVTAFNTAKELQSLKNNANPEEKTVKEENMSLEEAKKRLGIIS